MTQTIPAFLQRLKLGPDADSRAIRRAYARELKLIDHEADLPGFQALREMYESALAWAARQDLDTEAPASGRLPKPAPPLMQLDADDVPAASLPAAARAPFPDAQALADTVFARLAAFGKLLAQEGASDDSARWEAELRSRLDDDELLNITARNLFERRVAQVLSDGGTLECGPLFNAAAAVFNWEHDRRRLQQFGQAGAFLDRVIDERTMFQGQDMTELVKQRNVLARLRKSGPPTTLQLRRSMFYVERMLARFPNFMAVMVIPQVVQEWRAKYQELSAQAPPDLDAMPEPVLHGYTQQRGFDKAWIVFIIMGLVQIARVCGFFSP